jgi:hypothetical protein
VAGCISSSTSGGSCGSGAAAAGFSTYASGKLGLSGPGGAVIATVIGGTASVIGGGKFRNGAITAAYSYLFSPSSAQLHAVADESGTVYARTQVTFWGKIEVTYANAYYDLDSISQEAVQQHEAWHVGQLRPFVSEGWPFQDYLAPRRAIAFYGSLEVMELQAYRLERTVLSVPLDSVPRSYWTREYYSAAWRRYDVDQSIRNLEVRIGGR